MINHNNKLWYYKWNHLWTPELIKFMTMSSYQYHNDMCLLCLFGFLLMMTTLFFSSSYHNHQLNIQFNMNCICYSFFSLLFLIILYERSLTLLDIITLMMLITMNIIVWYNKIAASQLLTILIIFHKLIY